MTGTEPKRDERESLSRAVPGWQGYMGEATVEKVIQGVAIEQERLCGSRFLVLLRWSQLWYDGYMESVEIVGGFQDETSAVSAARLHGAQRLIEVEQAFEPRLAFQRKAPLTPGWPPTPAFWEGGDLPRFADRLWDGQGWHAIEVNAGVIPTDPDNPINLSVIEAINMMWETVFWFKEVADKAS